jgi:hypothetical protein
LASSTNYRLGWKGLRGKKRSSLLQKFVKYGHKKFYNIGYRSHFITGGISGHNDSLTSTEVLDETGWHLKLPPLPIPISDHCTVLLNSTTVMVIGVNAINSFSSINDAPDT